MRRARTLAVLLPLLALAAACGGSSSGASSSQASSHTTGVTTTATSEPSSSTASTTTTQAGSPTAEHPCGVAAAGSGSYAHVIVVVMENHGFDQIAGASPYLNGLAAKCELATNYHAVTHPSLPNYIAITSGTTGGLDGVDCEPAPGCSTGAPSIFGQTTWRVYAEGMPGPCARNGSGDYAPRHNPALYFTAPAVTSACAANDLPLGDGSGLRQALADPGSLAHYVMLIPDLCHDEHDCPVGTGDAWLAQHLPAILDSPAYRDGSTALVVTYDEDDHGEGNRVYTVVVSPTTAPGTRSDGGFTHASLLRTAEELLGVPLLGPARGAPSMRAAFGL
jgi:phospholipase C